MDQVYCAETNTEIWLQHNVDKLPQESRTLTSPRFLCHFKHNTKAKQCVITEGHKRFKSLQYDSKKTY
jgi:hypothetical protein